MEMVTYVRLICYCGIDMSDERRIVILYGSETGTAEDVAERIERDAIRRHFCVTIKPLDQYNIVCVVSKY